MKYLCILLVACSPAANQKAASTALDLTQIACVIANAESDDATLKAVCNIASDLIPEVQPLIASTKVHHAKMAGRCKEKDGGP